MKLVLVLLIAVVSFQASASSIVEVSVKGMVCSFCAQGIEKKFKSEPSVEKVDVILEHHRVSLVLKEGQQLSDASISTILKDAGYAVEKVVRK